MDEYASLRKIEFELCGGNLPEKYKAFVRRVLNDRNLIPAADVAPVVRGRWSDAGFGELPKHAPYGWACSVCGGISFNNEYIYCPNCGAKMDGGADNDTN